MARKERREDDLQYLSVQGGFRQMHTIHQCLNCSNDTPLNSVVKKRKKSLMSCSSSTSNCFHSH